MPTGPGRDTPQTFDLYIPVLPSRYVRSSPAGPSGHPELVEYWPAAVAFQTVFGTDAHFTAYQNTQPFRLNSGAANAADPPEMTALVVDIDAHDSADQTRFRAEQRRRAGTLPGNPYGYFTARGARLIWRLDPVVYIRGEDDARAWSRYYVRTLTWLAAIGGGDADPACRDWTRIFRLPHGTRDGVVQVHGRVCGDPVHIGVLPRIDLSDRDALDIARALARRSEAWTRVLPMLIPPPPVRTAAPHRPVSARGALAYACDRVARSGAGCRNSTLYANSRWLGELVAKGEVTAAEAREGLVSAAAACGLHATEAALTIDGALRR